MNLDSGLLIDIGGTKCSMQHSGKSDLFDTIRTESLGTPQAIMEHLEKVASGWGQEVEFVAVSFGGPFDFDRQRVRRSVHVSGWEDFSFSDWAKLAFGAQSIADNDANVGALGEYSTRTEVGSLAYVTISTGIGAGLIIGGRSFRGVGNLAGELGHTVIDSSGPKDDRGVQGTLERFCSGYWLSRDHGKSAEELLSDDDFLKTYSKRLGTGLSNLIQILNPEVLVLGGGISRSGERLKVALEENMSGLLSESGTRLEISGLGSQNVLLGARELARIELRS